MRAVIAKTLLTAVILLTLIVEGWGASASLAVSATVLSKSNCKFSTATGTLPFGNIDSGGSADASATASLTFRCNGSAPIATYLISDDDGLNANRMAHTSLAGTFLPYQLSYTPTTGSVPRGDPVTLSISGTVRSSDYRVAVAGAYSDTVILSILP